MVVPARPSSPVVSIDYINENTNQSLSSTIEYSANISMSGALSCPNAKLDLVPGNNLYFRVKSTGSSFASLVTTLTVASRPAVPAVTFSYSTENSSAVGTDLEWSEDPSLSSVICSITRALQRGIEPKGLQKAARFFKERSLK